MAKAQPSFPNPRLSIVCLGSWNKKLFTPQWISQNLYDSPHSNKLIEGTINPVELEFTFRLNNVSLIPKEKSIELLVHENSEDAINYANKLFVKIITLLPHTPIVGLGFNIQYAIDDSTNLPLWNYLLKLNHRFEDFMTEQVRVSRPFGHYSLRIITTFSVNPNIIFNFAYNSNSTMPNQDVFLNHFKECQSLILKETL